MILHKLKKLYYFIRSHIKKNDLEYLNYQEKMFSKNNLDRKKGIEIFKKIRSDFEIPHSSMDSEHQVIFSSISQKKESINKILEIGTYDGKNAFLLSKLFPQSEITTIDLPEEDEKFKNYYDRGDKIKFSNFIEKRNSFIDQSSNVNFKKINSLNLIFEENKFDLIWIDGAHGFPFATSDILNSLRLCQKDGWIICDDIYTSRIKKPDEMYNSNTSIDTLKHLHNAKIISYDLFLKRIEKIFNYFPSEQKFIAIIKK